MFGPLLDSLPHLRRLDMTPISGRGRLLFKPTWTAGTASALALSLWIVLAEIDRLIADAASSTGRSASASSLQAIDPRLGQKNWGIWNDLAGVDPGHGGQSLDQQVGTLLGFYFVLDAVFAVLYIAVLMQFFRAWHSQTRILWIVLASELSESALQLLTLHAWPAAQPGDLILTISMWVTWFKWTGLAAVLLSIFALPTLRGAMRVAVIRTWQALFIHRIALVILLLISALALLPIAGVNDQMPDTQRAWLEARPGAFLTTSAVALFVAGGLFYLGRRRSQLIWRIYHTVGLGESERAGRIPDRNQAYKWWVLPPIGLVVAYVVVRLAVGPDFWAFGGPLGAAVGVPLLAAAGSFLIPFWGRHSCATKVPEPNPVRAVDTVRCGDVLAMAFLAMTGMALIGSFSAPLVLELAGSNLLGNRAGWAWFYMVAGFVIMLLAFPAGTAVIRRWGKKLLDPQKQPSTGVNRAGRLLFGLAVLVLAGYTVCPASISGVVGVPGTAMLLAAAWGLIVGLVVVSLQEQRPLRVFAAMKLEANPVLSLIVAVMLLGAIGGTPGLHAVRTATGPGTDEAGDTRKNVDTTFMEWLKQESPCVVQIPGQDVSVRPMILVAAEGGGIRAASWTTRALEKLRMAKACAEGSVLLSSGVSGGSVGLTLSQLYGSEAVPTMKSLAAPEALAAAVSGMFAGDMIGATIGLKVPTLFQDPATEQKLLAWNDRAGLLESVWEQSASKLAEPFGHEPSGITGALLLNSTDTGSGCRVVISQIKLPGRDHAGTGQAGINCTDAQDFPLSIDLLDATSQCLPKLRWSTAALLSARFPIISPAGRVAVGDGSKQAGTEKSELKPGCSDGTGLQLIDGGYSEGSALGTISDLWPAVQKVVMEHNACVLTTATKPETTSEPGLPPKPTREPQAEAAAQAEGKDCSNVPDSRQLVVPVFLFLQNSPGADIIPQAPKAAQELLVPLVGLNAKNLQVGAAAWIERLNANANVCPDPAPKTKCTEASDFIKAALGGASVVKVAPDSIPALAAPLGWSLSGMSQDQLARAMDAEARTDLPSDSRQSFGKLLHLLAQ